MKRIAAIFLFFFMFEALLNAKDVKCDTIQNSCEQTAKIGNSKCNSCGLTAEVSNNTLYTNTVQLLGISILIILLTFYFYSLKKKKIYFFGASLLIIVLSVVTYMPRSNTANSFASKEKLPQNDSIGDLFTSTTDEFQPASQNDKDSTSTSTSTQIESIDEFSSATDEFISTEANDEFKQPINSDSISPIISQTSTHEKKFSLFNLSSSDTRLLIENLILFILIIFIGLMIRNSVFQSFRGIFLVATLVYFGFYKGGCPCMIMSFQKLILFFVGIDVGWVSLVWFLMLIPATYFFGKIWCGWLCHLGALQEFIFIPSRMKLLKSVRSQLIIRRVRIVVLIVLVIQLIVTKSNIFVHYDPFKVAFNLFSSNTLGYILLVILLVTSVLIYRPFCRVICPVGLILGWVSLLPKARTIKKSLHCIDCVSCSKCCEQKAIIYNNKKSYLSVQDCILCGNCLSSCKTKSLIYK